MTLLDLPVELLTHIISFLAITGSPSQQNLHEVPSEVSLFSSDQPLKNLARACHATHQSVYPLLLKFLKADIENISALYRFVKEYNLHGQVHSLVLYSGSAKVRYPRDWPSDPEDKELPTNDVTDPWVDIDYIIRQLDPSSVTFMLPPHKLHIVLPYLLDLEHAWAFETPYHTLHLQQPAKYQQQAQALSQTSAANLQQPPKYQQQPQALSPVNKWKVLDLRRWSHITYNQGCSIPAYGTYEYFHKKAPSMFAPIWRNQVPWRDSNSGPIDGCPLQSLSTFDLVAVFPYHQMPSTRLWLNTLTNLQHLRVQFAPSRNNYVLDDPMALGTCQREDLWSEFERVYRELTQAVAEGCLQRLANFTSLDYQKPGLCGMIDAIVNDELPGWLHDGEGQWYAPGEENAFHSKDYQDTYILRKSPG